MHFLPSLEILYEFGEDVQVANVTHTLLVAVVSITWESGQLLTHLLEPLTAYSAEPQAVSQLKLFEEIR